MSILKEGLTYLKNIPVKFFESAIQAEVDKRYTAAVNNEKEDASWRRITDVQRKRDLPPLKQDKMIRVVDYLSDRNPIAKKSLRLTADFVIGEGIQIKANKVEGREEEQKELQKYIDQFMEVNQWDLKQFDRIEELGKYGEQAYRTFINQFSGLVKLGVFDPEMINKVLSNPENAEELTHIIPKGNSTDEELKLEIIRPRSRIIVDSKDKEKEKTTDKGDPENKSDHHIEVGPQRLVGDTFFFTVNRGSHGTRGKSDLLSFADWLDMYDRTLYTMTERVTFLLTFIWEIIIEGGTPAQMKKRMSDLGLNPPKPGSFQVHNEKEKWEANSPDLKGADFNDFFKTMSTMLTGGSGYPEHWLFGKGEDVNKASAQEMAAPTLRQLKRRQKYVVYMFRQMIDFQIQQKIDKGFLEGSVRDYPYSIILPDPSKKEAKSISDAFAQLAPNLAVAVSNDFLTKETATKVLTMLISQLGIEANAEDESKNMTEANKSKLYDSVSQLFKEMNILESDSEFKTLKNNKVELTEQERKKCLEAKAVWHFGKEGAPSPAVWKSKNKDGSFTFVTNTHRAYNKDKTLAGAIKKFHGFIKGTA